MGKICISININDYLASSREMPAVLVNICSSKSYFVKSLPGYVVVQPYMKAQRPAHYSHSGGNQVELIIRRFYCKYENLCFSMKPWQVSDNKVLSLTVKTHSVGKHSEFQHLVNVNKACVTAKEFCRSEAKASELPIPTCSGGWNSQVLSGSASSLANLHT